MAAYGYLSDLAAQFNVLARHLDEELPRLVETVALMAETGGMDALSVFTFEEMARALTTVHELRFNVSQRDERISALEREVAALENTRATMAQALAMHEQQRQTAQPVADSALRDRHQELVDEHTRLRNSHAALRASVGSAESLFNMLSDHLRPELEPQVYQRMRNQMEAVLTTRSTAARMETAERQTIIRRQQLPKTSGKYASTKKQ